MKLQHLKLFTALGQMLGEIAVMQREQVVVNRQQLEALTERQTQLLQSLLAQSGARSLSPSRSRVSLCTNWQQGMTSRVSWRYSNRRQLHAAGWQWSGLCGYFPYCWGKPRLQPWACRPPCGGASRLSRKPSSTGWATPLRITHVSSRPSGCGPLAGPSSLQLTDTVTS